jgi:hypothetical protein
MKITKNIVYIFPFIICACSSYRPIDENSRNPASFQSCLESVNNIINYKIYTGSGGESFSNASSLEILEASYGAESLIDIQRRLSDEEIKANNTNLKKLLKEPLYVKPILNKKEFVTNAEAAVIYKAMNDSKVNRNHNCYDPKGTIGFCFGRATIAHLEAVVRNIHPNAIKKIWIAGDMEKWGHHVATMIKTENNWLVLDTNLGRAVSSEEWIAKYMPFKANNSNEIMVFVTQAGRFGPYDTKTYNATDLFNSHTLEFDKSNDYYRGYFHDYLEDLDHSSLKP